MTYNRNQRNKIGLIAYFFLGVLLSGLATVIAIAREMYQANKGNSDLETEDVINYSISSALGATVQTVVLAAICIIF